jgi:hypothetical protein
MVLFESLIKRLDTRRTRYAGPVIGLSMGSGKERLLDISFPHVRPWHGSDD